LAKRAYIVRKLCSSIEEYEAAPRERMVLDLGLLAEKLKEAGFEEVVVQGPHLTILVDDIGVVAQVYQSGTILLQAALRDDVERACDLIYAVALTENAKQAKKTVECHFE